MASYDVKKKEKTVFEASKMSQDQKNIVQFEFYQKDDGWYIERWDYNIESPFPHKTEMYLPADIIEQIILVEKSKNNLS